MALRSRLSNGTSEIVTDIYSRNKEIIIGNKEKIKYVIGALVGAFDRNVKKWPLIRKCRL